MKSPDVNPLPAAEPDLAAKPGVSLSRFKSVPGVVTIAAAMVVIAGLRFGREVLIPIALSMLLSFLLAPLVSRLERWRMKRIPAVLTVVTTVMVAMATTGWFVLGEVSTLAERLPEYKTTLHSKLADVRATIGGGLGKTAVLVKELGDDLEVTEDSPASADVVRLEVAERPWTPATWVRNAVWPAVGVLAFLGIVALFVTFMLLQKEGLRDRFIWMVGDQQLHLTTQMLEEASHKVSQYLLSQLLINGLQGIMVGVGLALIGVPDPLLWGIVAAILRFLPYVGPWIAALCPILVSIAVFEGWTRPFITIGLFLGTELLSNNVIEPYLYAARTGVSSLAILVAGLFWTWLWGGIGLVLSTPLTVCLVVMGKYVSQLRAFSVVLGDKPALSVAARLYQRVLSNDHAGAMELLASQLKASSLLEVYDSTVMAALHMAAQDCRKGEIEETRREEIQRSLSRLVEETAALEAQELEKRKDEEPVEKPSELPLKMLCLPTTDLLDEAAALMLRNVLRQDGVDCEVLSAAYLAGEILDIIAEREVDVVCVSHVPPPHLPPIRYLCKRLAQKYEALPVIVGAWCNEASAGKVNLGLPQEGEFHVAGTLAEARAHANQLYQHVRVTRLIPTAKPSEQVVDIGLELDTPGARA